MMCGRNMIDFADVIILGASGDGGRRMVAGGRCMIVGIGASAGGIEAFKRFFENLPEISRMAIVVVLHLSPERHSLLPELIGRWTSVPVSQVADGMAVEDGYIYVIPPKTIMTIERRVLHLREREPLTLANRPIDVFFSALAIDQGEHAVGIVLSGTGTDGSVGLRAIKNHGGLTLVQEGGDYSGMPDSAVSTGAVDLVLPVEAMPGRLAALLRVPLPAGGEATTDLPRQETVSPASHSAASEPASLRPVADLALAAIEQQRLAICTILRNQIGHDFSQYKQPTFLRRVQRRMQVLQRDAAGYVEALEADPHEVGLLFKDLLIGVTSFFRDETTFETVGRLVMPVLFEGKGASDRVRVWVSGCATGEEAYSIAIMLREASAHLPAPPKLEVFATDIDEAAISIARNGRYPKPLVSGMSAARIKRFFTTADDDFIVGKDIPCLSG